MPLCVCVYTAWTVVLGCHLGMTWPQASLRVLLWSQQASLPDSIPGSALLAGSCHPARTHPAPRTGTWSSACHTGTAQAGRVVGWERPSSLSQRLATRALATRAPRVLQVISLSPCCVECSKLIYFLPRLPVPHPIPLLFSVTPSSWVGIWTAFLLGQGVCGCLKSRAVSPSSSSTLFACCSHATFVSATLNYANVMSSASRSLLMQSSSFCLEYPFFSGKPSGTTCSS